MIAEELDYSEMYGEISRETDNVVAAKCRCVACNSCSCGRCILCIGQCTGCKSNTHEFELEWSFA